MKNSFLAIAILFCLNLSAITVDRFVDIQQDSVRRLNELRLVSPGIIETMSKIEVVSAEHFKKPEGSTRWSAFADIQNKKIYLNEKDSVVEGNLQVFVIHELLSASGVEDVDYQHSVVASLLIENAKSNFYSGPLSEKFEAQMGSLAVNRSAKNTAAILPGVVGINESNKRLQLSSESGSWTIVGTGGDVLSAIVKERLLRRLIISFPNQTLYNAITSAEWIFGLKIERFVSKERRPNLRAIARFDSKTNNFKYLILAPTSFDVAEIEKDLWYFLIHSNYRNNTDKLYDIEIPHTLLERKVSYRSRHPR